MDYGTGAIFGCPAHDQRDLDFARKYALPVHRVIADGEEDGQVFSGDEAYVGAGRVVNSHFLNGMSIDEAKAAIITLAEHDGWGQLGDAAGRDIVVQYGMISVVAGSLKKTESSKKRV